MDRLAEVAERIAATNSRNKKIHLLAEYLQSLASEDAFRAIRFLSGVPLADASLSVGGALLGEAAAAASGSDLDLVWHSVRETGDSGEGISLLLAERTENRPLSLAEAEQIFERLAMARRTALKLSILTETFQRYRPLTLRYFIKTITGNWRIGVQSKMVREAAAAAGLSFAWLEPQIFRPIEFMLAKPLEQARTIDDPENWRVEDKYDGIRAQVHFDKGSVAIFTRGLEDTTVAFPEVVEQFAALSGSGIVDGEILAWRDNRAMAFTVLQQRIARKRVAASLRVSVPVAFMGYDVLLRDGKVLLDDPIEVRRAVLDAMGILCSPWEVLGSVSSIDERYLAARDRGNEGLILKRAGSIYEPGKRTGLWIKVKRPYGTLDVVVTAAEQGHGRRATVLSDYTFAVRDGDQLLNVGKAYSGLTDEEIRELTRLFRALTTEHYGRVSLVRPEVVLEVAFDGVQKSARHKSGYALRFPRILRWRRDKSPSEIDTIDEVKALYDASLHA